MKLLVIFLLLPFQCVLLLGSEHKPEADHHLPLLLQNVHFLVLLSVPTILTIMRLGNERLHYVLVTYPLQQYPHLPFYHHPQVTCQSFVLNIGGNGHNPLTHIQTPFKKAVSNDYWDQNCLPFNLIRFVVLFLHFFVFKK